MPRKSMRSTASADLRRPSRRFFGRSSSSTLRSTRTMPPDDDMPRRRSFLAKPSAPGAARRVLAVLNQSRDKRPSSSPRKHSSSQPSAVSSAYQDDSGARLRVAHSHHSHRHTHPAPRSQSSPPSPLNKPIAPSRHVRPLDDLPDSLRSDSAAVSVPFARSSSRVLPIQSLVEADASEISDDIHSGTDPKSRSGRFSPSTSPSPEREREREREQPLPTQHLVFSNQLQTEHVKFKTVGAEEAYVPSAPNAASPVISRDPQTAQVWASFEERIRVLQSELAEARETTSTTERINQDLRLRNKELDVLVNSLRTRSSESHAEVEELTRHLKETRKRLTRRIRELEEELSSQKTAKTDPDDRQRDAEPSGRSEQDTWTGQAIARTGSVPSLPARKRRSHGAMSVTSAQSDVNTRPLATDAMMSHPSQNLVFARVRSTGNVHDHARRRSMRSEPTPVIQRPGTPSRRVYTVGGDTDDVSPRTLARRSLIRRALIAHIHSSRYRSARNAWYEFLGGVAGNVTPDQFARAVRSLAIAADARNDDLLLLRQEVSGAEECDTGVLTWGMFFRFYQITKNEQT